MELKGQYTEYKLDPSQEIKDGIHGIKENMQDLNLSCNSEDKKTNGRVIEIDPAQRIKIAV